MTPGRTGRKTSALRIAAFLLTAMLPGRADAQFGLVVNLDDLIVDRGQVVTASISIYKLDGGASALYGAGFKLRYDVAALEVLEVELDPAITAPGMLHFQNLEPESGVVALSFTRTFGSGFAASLEVGRVSFRIRTTAPSGFGTIWFEDYAGVSADGAPLISSASDFTYLVFGEPLGVGPSGRTLQISLGPAAPNPTQRSIRSSLTLPGPASVEVSVVDVRGRAVGMTVRQDLPAGAHTLKLDLEGQPPGIYFLVCRVNGTIHRRAFARL